MAKIDIDIHILKDIANIQIKKKEARKLLISTWQDLLELDTRETALLLHMVNRVDNIDTGMGQEGYKPEEVEDES